MQNPKGIIALPALAIAVIIAGLLAGGSYWYAKSRESKNANTTVVVNENTNTAVVTNSNANTNTVVNGNTNVAVNGNTNTTVDATAGWKTYTNAGIGYIVKYPPTWKVSACVGSTAVSFGLQGLKCDSDAPSEDFGIAEIIDSVSVSSRVASLTAAMVSPVQSQVTVSGIQGTRIVGVHKKDSNAFYGGGQYSDDIFFVRNGKTYRLGYFILGGEKKYVSEFESFYKTFIFTDRTAGWKTYTNTDWDFSFKYPGDWSVTKNNVQGVGKEAIPENALLISKGQRPSLQLYVDPMGWGVGNSSYVITVKKQSGKFVILKEEATTAQPGEFGLGEYYTVSASEAAGAINPKVFITFASDIKGQASSDFNELVKTILSSFTFLNQTAGWKMYTNITYGYTLRYPQTYSSSGTADKAVFRPTENPGGNSLSILHYTGKNAASFDTEEQADFAYAKSGDYPARLYTNRRTTTIGGKTFTTFDYDTASASGMTHSYYVDGSDVWMIWANRSPMTNTVNDTILSSFTFTK